MLARVRAIGGRVRDLLRQAQDEGLAPHRFADRVVEERLRAARQHRSVAAH